MQEIKPGSRVVYCAEEGGFNALVTKVFNDKNESMALIYIDEKGLSRSVTKAPNVHHATENIEREIQVKKVKGGPLVMEKVKGPGLSRFGYWRR